MKPATYTIKRVYLQEWGVTLTLVLDSFGAHCVVREICHVLGVSNVADQVAKIQRRKALTPYLRQFNLPTKRGDKDTWCLHLHALAFWLALFDPDRVRPEFETGLVAFQVKIVDLAAQLLEAPNIGDESKIIYLAERLGTVRDIQINDED